MKYEVQETDQLKVSCPNDPLKCKDHCHWRIVDTVEDETIGYFYDKDVLRSVVQPVRSRTKRKRERNACRS